MGWFFKDYDNMEEADRRAKENVERWLGTREAPSGTIEREIEDFHKEQSQISRRDSSDSRLYRGPKPFYDMALEQGRSAEEMIVIERLEKQYVKDKTHWK